jgi:hypothetical protein
MKKLMLAAIIFTIAFTACKKSKLEEPISTPIPSLIGLWKGKFSADLNTQPTQDVIFYFKQAGVVRVFNGLDTTTASQKADGTWTIQIGAIFGGGGFGTMVNVEYSYPIAPTVYYSTRFQSDENLTKSISPTIWDQWGLGRVYYNLNSFTPKGKVVLTKQ